MRIAIVAQRSTPTRFNPLDLMFQRILARLGFVTPDPVYSHPSVQRKVRQLLRIRRMDEKQLYRWAVQPGGGLARSELRRRGLPPVTQWCDVPRRDA